jgi:hypothetical protein
MLEVLFLQMDETENPDIMLEQDGALPHFSNIVQVALK